MSDTSPLTPKDQETLEELREMTVTCLSAAFDLTKPVALLDFPIHTNVGDHMIYAGERAYLSRLGVNVVYLTDVTRFDAAILRSRLKSGTVLIHGGGNFGDIWPAHQEFRERVIRQLQDYPIVQLPQTIYFGDAANSERANRILSQHPDFTLMVRDTPSLNRARTLLPDIKTVFVPDMALGWTPFKNHTAAPAPGRVIVLARTDREAASGTWAGLADVLDDDDQVVDWNMTPPEQLIYWLARVPSKASNGRGEQMRRRLLYPAIERSFQTINEINLRSGTRLFSRADLLVTDRLHAHVLATLMGVPNIAVDNSYGKVRALFDDYTHKFSTSHFATSAENLKELISQLRDTRKGTLTL